MKTLLLFLFSFAAFSQTTFNVQITGDPVVAITLQAEALAAGTNMMLGTVGPGTSPTTLTAAATSAQTTFTVANALGVKTCMGIVTGSEVSVITGISGNVLTVTRHTIGTTAAAYNNGQAVSFIAWGTGTCWIANLTTLGFQSAMLGFPGPTVTTQNAAIVTANSAISSALSTSVTHTP